LITHHYPINEAAQAIAVAADRNSGSGKVLLRLT
jgi:L-idonate 5-dehydrogenase